MTKEPRNRVLVEIKSRIASRWHDLCLVLIGIAADMNFPAHIDC